MENGGIRELLADAASRGSNYIEGLEVRDVGPLPGSIERLIKALDGPLPEVPSEATEILAFLDEYGSPATVANAGGRYFGFVTGGALPVTVASQYLAAAWDQNCFSFISSPAVACFETTALRWVKEAFVNCLVLCSRSSCHTKRQR
jgi:glutamate/tyrosine decarboxylase-like PLP-dependent enzyme